MVQVFDMTPTPSSASMIGNALGQGFSKRMGLAEAEKAAQNAQGDPVQLAFSLARANMASPGLERSLGQIYEQLLSRTGSNQYAENLGNASGNQMPGQMPNQVMQTPNPDMQGEINPTGIIAPSTDTPSNASPLAVEAARANPIQYPKSNNYKPDDIKGLSHQFMMAMRPDLVEGSSDWGRVPTFNYQEKSNLRPEEEGQIRQDLTNRKVMPQVQDKIIENLRNDIQTRYKEKLTNFGLDQNRQTEIVNKWDKFRSLSEQNLQPLLGKYDSTFGFGGRPRTANDLKTKYFQYAGNLPVNLTPEQMHAQAGAMLQNDINRLDALSAIPGMPFIRDPSQVEENVKDKKEAYRSLEKEGYYESLKEDAVSKDMGLEELHYTIWGDQTDKNSLKLISDVPVVKMYSEEKSPYALFGEDRTPNPNYVKEREPFINNLASKLTKIKDKDDLILLRAQVLNNGGLESDFNEALEKSQEKGLKLSPFQQTQLQELRIPRQRPIWEIFNPNAWKNWVRFQTGKR